MTRSHRAAHAWLWLLLAIVLPLVFFAALQVKPMGHPQNAVPQAALDALAAPAGTIAVPGEAPAAEPAADLEEVDGQTPAPQTPAPQNEGGR